MSRPRVSLSTLSATVTVALLLLSVVLSFIGVERYANLKEQQLLATLPPEASQAYADIAAGKVPDQQGLVSLVRTLPVMIDDSNLDIYVSVLLFGLLAALFCSVIGYWLARRISWPLETLTAAAEDLRNGDFSVRVPTARRGATEIVALVDTFNALATELETMERRLRFNTMAVAHELRTPLTIVQGTLQAMTDGVFRLDRDRIHSLLVQVEGLSRLVEDLRTLSLAASHSLVNETQRVDLAAEAATVLGVARPLLAEAGLVVETALQPAPAEVDSQRLRQGLLALIQNACRYAASGRIVRCETGTGDDGRVFVRLLDRGPGLPADRAAHTIDVFWRGEPSRSRATGGSGLGLSIVQAIATAHRGRLEIADRPGGGAAMTIVLPRAPALPE